MVLGGGRVREVGMKHTGIHRTLKWATGHKGSDLDYLPRETEGEEKVQKGKNQSVGVSCHLSYCEYEIKKLSQRKFIKGDL